MDLHAPSRWRCIDFVSDLHLQAGEPHTAKAWMDYMHATPADAVFLLGDIFEVWIGDDSADIAGSFESTCAETLKSAAQSLAVYIMHGNRDFLMGERFANRCAATLVPDPLVLTFAGTRVVLTHGDALCTDDVEYQRFRAEVRSAAWQAVFLAKPLAEREHIASALRVQSRAAQASKPGYAEVNALSVSELMVSHGAMELIHGHTHRPASHHLPGGYLRHVLSDWDMQATPPRAEVLRWSMDSGSTGGMQRLSLTQAKNLP